MLALDSPFSTDTIQQRMRSAEADAEDMPFAVHYDRPEPAERAIWLVLATFAGILLAALV